MQSPFSQKNIQECRCSTESCRGVLGPKPKKPTVEDRSITSAILAGTKRKFNDIVDSVRTKSECQSLPKKRKLHTGSSANTKAKNVSVATTAARERAEREAAEHSRQVASRQTRALKRSSITSSRRSQNSQLRNRLTTVTFQRKVPKVGALKAVRHQPAHLRPSLRTGMSKQSGNSSSRRLGEPSTPTRSSQKDPLEWEEDLSPNITPASLRSASRQSAITVSITGNRTKTPSNIRSETRSSRTDSRAGQRHEKRLGRTA